jgi:hypothetical protein
VRVRGEVDAPVQNAFERITERPAATSERRRELHDEVLDALPPRKRQHDDEVVEASLDEVVEEIEIFEEPPPKRRKKRRKKKLLRPLPGDEEESEIPAWIWWVGGGSGIAVTFATLLVIAVVASAESWLKLQAIILLVMLPVSTVVFFGAMILANVLVGAVEFGELHVAIVKSFGLVLLVNLISLVPFVGVYALAPIAWISGLMLLFHLDVWETFMVMFFNWVLNYLIRLLLLATLASAVMHGAPGGGIGTRQSLSKPALPAKASSLPSACSCIPLGHTRLGESWLNPTPMARS